MNVAHAPSDMPSRADRLWRGAAFVGRLALAGVLLAAALPKLADPAGFAAKLPNYQIFPDALVNLIAAVVPMLELLAALALVSGVLYRGGVWLAGGLLASFTALLASALARGLDLDCGCFGAAVQAEPVSWLDLLRNLVLLAVVLVLALEMRRSGRPAA